MIHPQFCLFVSLQDVIDTDLTLFSAGCVYLYLIYCGHLCSTVKINNEMESESDLGQIAFLFVQQCEKWTLCIRCRSQVS